MRKLKRLFSFVAMAILGVAQKQLQALEERREALLEFPIAFLRDAKGANSLVRMLGAASLQQKKSCALGLSSGAPLLYEMLSSDALGCAWLIKEVGYL